MGHRKTILRRLAGLAVSMLSVCHIGFGQTALLPCEALAENPVTVTGKRYSIAEVLPSNSTYFRVPVDSKSRYFRVRFEIQSPPDCDWYLTVRDRFYHVVQTFTPRTIKSPANQWTKRIPGSLARFELERCGVNAPVVKFHEYIWMPEEEKENVYYSRQDQDPTKARYYPLYKSSEQLVPTHVRWLGDSVGFMMASWGNKITWTCSGVLIARDLFLTNWHCGAPPQTEDKGYWSPEIVKDTIIDFSWDDDKISNEFMATECVAANKELDFAILRIMPIDTMEEPHPAVLRESVVTKPAQIRIVHHPAAMQKHISACEVVDIGPTFGNMFTHRCDTEAGSSGAPVFDEDGKVIGLHHLGFDVIVQNGECRYADKLNKAIRMDEILRFLDKNNNNLYKLLTIRK